MTSNELKTRLDASNEKVNKRITTLEKICKKLSIDKDIVLKRFNDYFSANFSDEYITSSNTEKLLKDIVSYKETHSYADEQEDNYEELCKYNDYVSQLIDNIKKLFELTKIRDNWQSKYNAVKSKEETPKIESIWKFLCDWQVKAHDYYVENAKWMIERMNEMHEKNYKFLSDNNYNEMSWKEQREFLDSHKKDIEKSDFDSFTKSLTRVVFTPDNRAEYNSYDRYVGNNARPGEYSMVSFDEETLNKTLEREKLAKYDDLCIRVQNVVGDIIDASNLSVRNQRGELNGIVIGTKSKAKVETVSAGGYNIQCFHYRVLVNKIK